MRTVIFLGFSLFTKENGNKREANERWVSCNFVKHVATGLLSNQAQWERQKWMDINKIKQTMLQILLFFLSIFFLFFRCLSQFNAKPRNCYWFPVLLLWQFTCNKTRKKKTKWKKTEKTFVSSFCLLSFFVHSFERVTKLTAENRKWSRKKSIAISHNSYSLVSLKTVGVCMVVYIIV